ncbi:hypothetical protein X474_22645 [Dethiosulfatarculus sandiegensis]|uniref:Uncharacterized protein n=1 Tax=Dethiosulfatarculus sandiegensis TaxID=1429043 RepID=A0A0D2J0I6_9BACT|nr:hypothetical protein X474_22645 [Dethiosulfatarculus sandiegensis]
MTFFQYASFKKNTGDFLGFWLIKRSNANA